MGRQSTQVAGRQVTRLYAMVVLGAVGCALPSRSKGDDRELDGPDAAPTSTIPHPAAGTEIPCAAERLADLTPNEPDLAFEIRSVCKEGVSVVESSGPSCSDAGCKDAVLNLDDQNRPLGDYNGCVEYVIAMRGDEVVRSGIGRDVVPLLVPIDTLDEAELALSGSCTQAWQTKEGYAILNEHNMGDCPILNEYVLWQVAPDATLTQLDSTSESTGLCYDQ